MKGVADDDQLEATRLGIQIFGTGGDRPDVGCADGVCLGADHFGHSRFGVHGPNVREPVAQGEGELAGAAGQIQQASAP